MSDLNLDFEDLWYIQLGPDSKLPQRKWGGYSQDYGEADTVYTAEEVRKSDHTAWGIAGMQNLDHGTRSLLIFDLDVYKAGKDFDIEDLEVPANTPITKSPSGGYHVYFFVHAGRGEGQESDFTMTQSLGWDIDIRGSYVSHHVVAPNDVPGVEGDYEIVQDGQILGVFNPADAAERIRYKGEPLLEHDPETPASDFEFDRPTNPPEDMPKCYHAGLELRKANPDTDEDGVNVNTHKVNVLTALCGLAAGYSQETITDHFVDEYAPGDNADRDETEYQVAHLARHMENGRYSPPSVSTLQDYNILNEDEACGCDIAYHGGGSDVDPFLGEVMWEWWSQARLEGDLDESSVIPEAALYHIASDRGLYDFDALPEDIEELPAKAYNQALWWVQNRWKEEADIPEDEDVTTRGYRARDPEAVLTWEDVRYIYDDSKEDGRHAAVNLLRSKYEFATPMDTEELHVYDSALGIFDQTAVLEIGRELDRNLGSHYSQHEKTEIVGRLRDGSYVDRDRMEAGDKDGLYLCVANGVLDLDTRELHDHDPEYLFTSLVPYDYDKSASADRIEEFLDDITQRAPDKKTLLEVLGNALLPNYDYELVMIIFGEGANGKSTWFNVMRRLLGKDNTTSITLQTLAENRFGTSHLIGKWAVLGEDLPEKKIDDFGPVKDLSGGETFVEPKGKQGFDFENRAKLMFAANRPPRIGDKSDAAKRRLVPIHLPNQFVPDPDPNDPREKERQSEGLVDELTTDEQLSGLLNLALDGLDRLREQEDVSLPESKDERMEYYEQFSDPIKEFTVNCLENVDGDRLAKQEVYNAYTEFCNANDYDSTSNNWFWRELRQTTFNVTEYRPSEGGREVYLRGATFADTAGEYIPSLRDETDERGTSSEEGDSGELADLSAGANQSFEVTVAEKLDPPEWLAGKGHVVDDQGNIAPYVCEGTDPFAAVGEGATVSLRRAKVEDRQGVPTLVLSGITELSTLQQASVETDQPAATDGGSQSVEEYEGTTANVHAYISDTFHKDQKFTAFQIQQALADTDPEHVKEALNDTLTEKGLVISEGKGEYRYNP